MAFTDMIASGIQGMFGMGQQHMAYDQQKRMQSRQYKFDKSMAEYAYSKELEQWHRANEYNLMVSDPKFTMDRLRKAGLNPMLMHKGAPDSAPGATTLPRYQAPRYPDAGQLSTPGIGLTGALTTLAAVANIAIQKRQVDKLQAEKNLVEQKVATESVNRAYRLAGIQGQYAQSKIKSDLAKYSSDLARTNLYKLQAETGQRQVELETMHDVRRHDVARRKAISDRAVTEAMKSHEEYSRYRKFGLTSQDQIQWRVAVNLLRSMGVNLSDPGTLFGK